MADLVRRLGGVIAWGSGSIAGISALVYAIGFLAYKSADNLLGIGIELTNRDAFLIVARGASVIARTTILAIWGVLLVLVIGGAWKFTRRRLRLCHRKTTGPVMRLAGRLAGPTAALLILTIAGYSLSQYVLPALDVKGLLFNAAGANIPCPENPLKRAVISDDKETLEEVYAVYSLAIGANVGVWLLAWPSLMGATARIWLLLGGMGVFLSVLGAPLAYGALVADKSAPVVTLSPPQEDAGTMRLLARDPRGVLVWLEDRGQIRWIAEGQFNTLTISAERSLMRNWCQ